MSELKQSNQKSQWMMLNLRSSNSVSVRPRGNASERTKTRSYFGPAWFTEVIDGISNTQNINPSLINKT